MGGGWVAGVCINLVGSIMINLGTNVMKMGHNRLAAINSSIPSSRPRPPIYKLREWQIGVSLFSLGNVANFVSFGYAAQSLLAAIGCVQFVSNVVFASWVLKEKVSRAVLAATACIVAGCVLLVSGGSHVSEKYTYKELLRLYAAPAYISYMAVGGAAVLLAYAGYWFGQKAVISKGEEAAHLWTAALPILYSVFSALIGTQSVLFSKTLAVLLRSTFAGDNQLNKWFTWFVLVAFLTTAVFWVTRLNKGLRMFPALIIVPALQICWTLFSILSGMLYFHEYEGMRAGPTAMFVIGVAVVFAGVFLLTRASQPGAAGGGAGKTAEQASSSSRIAYVKDEALQALRPTAVAASDDPQWELAAVRPAGSDRNRLELPRMQQGGLQQQQQQHELTQADDGDADDDASDEEEYERALLACTSGRCGGSSSSGTMQQQQQKQKKGASLLREHGMDAHDAAEAGLGGAPADPQQGTHLGADGKPLKGKKRWMSKASSLKRRVALDFSLDETAAAKLTLGLGDSHTPGFSLFTMPMVDVRELPHETSTWRSAEMVDGRSYGRLPEASTGGFSPHQGLPLLSVPCDHDETACISQGGAGPGPPPAAAAARMRDSEGSFLNVSFTWPPGRSEPSEAALPVAGPFKSINPLANAIDLRSQGNSKTPSRVASQDEAPSATSAASKWRKLQTAISLTSKLKTIVQEGRTASQDEVVVAVGSPRALERSNSSSTGDGGGGGNSSSGE